MANPLDPMDLKQVITLKMQGYSNRKIAGMLRINRNTLNTYIQKFETCEHDHQTLLNFSPGKLRELFPIKTPTPTKNKRRIPTQEPRGSAL